MWQQVQHVLHCRQNDTFSQYKRATSLHSRFFVEQHGRMCDCKLILAAAKSSFKLEAQLACHCESLCQAEIKQKKVYQAF